MLVAFWSGDDQDQPQARILDGRVGAFASLPVSEGMVRIPAGTFYLGSWERDLPDAGPVRRIRLGAFWIDRHEITNGQFAQFVGETFYVTTAEQVGRSRVFAPRSNQWQDVVGADWRHPTGPDSSIAGREAWPVVHVSWHDALAYARWAGKRLPTEAEYECAARGGLAEDRFPWGSEERPGGRLMANYWQGHFPSVDRRLDARHGLAPVGSYPSNGFGLHDMVGNTWSWCADWYHADAYQNHASSNPQGPSHGQQRVRRGGSWLSAENVSFAIRVAARGHAAPETSTNDISFRCARDARATD